MANEEHLKIIKQGVKTWNAWRLEHPEITPNLSEADLNSEDLKLANLSGVNLRRADLNAAKLSLANLSGADLGEATLYVANLSGADLRGADFNAANLILAILTEADLNGASLNYANLSGAILRDANLIGASLQSSNLIGTYLSGADFNGANVGGTVFANSDLSTAKGLDSVNHTGPSTIGVDTLFKSDGKIPNVFLRGTGIPEDFITFLPSLLVLRAIQFYSCFISYSHHDKEFSQRLHSRMRSEHLRVWYAPEDMQGGRKLHEEIFNAIQIHDKLLLVLSERSMKSEWVSTEILRAKRVEREENRRKLFPIRLVDFKSIQKWECFDADSGKDLALELREYYIPDFSNWKDHDVFEAEFAKLLRDLRATEL
jgi:uncharacterized protein YjbI with pentapeptide repeats